MMNNRIYAEYDLYSVIGQGAFSLVCKGKRKKDGLIVAVKIVKIQNESHEKIIKKEIEIMKSISGGHVTIPILYDSFKEDSNYFIIMEYFGDYITLLEWANNRFQTTKYGDPILQSNFYSTKKDIVERENEILLIFKQIVSGINFLHKSNVFHRDLKLENLMINNQTKEIKIIDFGLATHSETKNWSTICGSFEYLAPEIIQNISKNYESASFDDQSEIWSLGIILYAIAFYKLPFYSDNQIDLFKQIIYSSLNFNKEDFLVSDELKDLILQMTKKNPDERLNLNRIEFHPFFRKNYKMPNCFSVQIAQARKRYSRSVEFNNKPKKINHYDSAFTCSIANKSKSISTKHLNVKYRYRKSPFASQESTPILPKL